MENNKPLYRRSREDAAADNEVQEWRESYRENCDCARAIERSIDNHYHDNVLDDGTGDIIERYGFDRVNWVLANTLQQNSHDGRFSQKNKNWAEGFCIPNDDMKWHFCVESHPGLTNLFVDQVRQAWQNLGYFGSENCISEMNGEIDYKGRLLVIDPAVLKECFRTPENQLFLAAGGFGCSPNSRGRKVYGSFLNDGCETYFNRGDFLGVIKDEYIPEWATVKLEELTASGNDEPEDIMMGGI